MSKGRRTTLLVVLILAAGAAASTATLENGRGSQVSRLTHLGKPVYCGGGTRPYVALTFDDGPTHWAPTLLRVLRANGARATFFEIGSKAARHPELVRLEAAAGELADHSWSHPTLPGLSRGRVVDELGRAQRVIARISGRPVTLVRPPFGAEDPVVAEVARDLGLLVVLWNVDSGDASAASTPPSSVVARQLADRIRPGAIVLLHEDETVPTAVDAMRTFLPILRSRGLQSVTVSDLLRLDPPAPGSLGNAGGCNVSWSRA